MADVVVGGSVRVKGNPTPVMTVSEIKDGQAKCVWSVGNDFKEKWFPVAILEVNTEPTNPGPTYFPPKPPDILQRAGRFFGTS